MQTLTIILERHSQLATFEYLNGNQDYLRESLICVETRRSYLKNALQPLELFEMQYHIDLLRSKGSFATYSLLKDLQHSRVYPIDGFDGIDESCIVEILSTRMGDVDAGIKYLNRIHWLRDEYMAKCLLKLLLQNPERNIVAIVGQRHHSILYHLLYLLPENLLRMPIRVINLVDSPISAGDDFYKDFYCEEVPFDKFDCSSKKLPALNSPVRTRLLSTTTLRKFKQDYENRNLSYQVIRQKVENLLDNIRKLCPFSPYDAAQEKKRPPEYSLQKISTPLVNGQLLDFIQTPLPPNGELLGRELCSIPWGGLAQESKVRHCPQEFMIKHYPPQFMIRHYDPWQMI